MAASANPYLVLDTATGRVCDDRSPVAASVTSNAYAKFGGREASNPLDRLLVPKADPVGLPYCGR
jgi:hypothetical protein